MANNETNQAKSPLAARTHHTSFPLDEFIDVCIISYMTAAIPKNPKFAKNKTDGPTPSVRFLIAGYVNNPETGEKEVVRKWTKWMVISYDDRAALVNLFKGVPQLESILTTNRLWETPFKALVEKSEDGKYSTVSKLKLGEDHGQMGIVYNKDFVPYKHVQAFGNLVYLELALCKEEDGVHTYTQADMIEPPKEDENEA